jgi:glycosyltransferase involved in cell wall biosynthesis
MAQTKIAIVTTTRNDESTILSTLASIHLQTFTDWQHVVKDAGSTDKTLRILDTNGVKLSYLTGKDAGIYDALNIAQQKVTAEWTIVVQSGDTFYNKTVLAEVAPYLTDDVDIVYGDIVNVHSTGVREVKHTHPVNELWKGMIGSHQGMFIRTSLLKKYPYNLTYKIAADYNFLWQCYTNGARFKQIPVTICLVDGAGLSSLKIVENLMQKQTIANIYDTNPFHSMHRMIRIGRVAFTKQLKKYMPQSLVKKVIEWRAGSEK